MNKQYLIKLKPIDKFFFGGEMTFSFDGDDSEYASYVIKSNYFPQQTSLLGMLRFLILRNSPYFENGHIKTDCVNQVEKLIGAKSFSIKEGRTYGAIEKIGNCLILKDGKPMQIAPFINWSDEKLELSAFNGNDKKLPNIQYDHKKGYSKSLDDGTPLDKVFVKDYRLGINRNIESGEVEGEALYKQEFYRFNDESDYQFAFIAEINDDKTNLENIKDDIVYVGGDNSQFRIEIVPNTLPEITKSDKLMITLQSPAFIDDATVNMADFFVAETIKFNYLQTSVQGTKCYHRTKENGINKENSAIELYDSASVFYFSNKEQKNTFIENLKGKENVIIQNFNKIGYNQYV